jgi:phenylalanyl-tRNA synthetase beta chain
MKFSYSWISEFVSGLDVPAQALERLITMKTAECEGVEVSGCLLADAVIARVESVDGKVATVDAGRHGKRTVVCGANNLRAGLLTVWVPLGIKTIGGVHSDGMLASGAELDINRDHEGIIELGPVDKLPFTDSVIEIDNKSLTHRPDLWGHYGMAREVAAITGRHLIDPVKLGLLPAPGSPIKIEIEDATLCPRFSALVFENVTVQPSPLWLQARLTAAGLNPINNIVDLTNYLLAELAQPTHAYDRAKLHGDTLYARPARPGERVTGLNHIEYELAPTHLVIADGAGPVGVAGVIGGLDSAISETTTSIVLEAANFNASSVRKTSSQLKIRTDASIRFEKAQDPHNTVRALARALELLPILSPGIRLVGGLADNSSELRQPPPVKLDLEWLARKLGRVLEAAEVRRILESLQFGVSDDFSVTIPSWRATKDVAMPEDLVEEVGRMIGYESIPPAPPLVLCAPSFDPPAREALRQVKRTIAAQGFTEVSNYSFISEEDARRFGFAIEDHIRVLNPIAAGQELMRTSLLPGIWRNIVENAKHADEFRLFEIGREIHKGPREDVHLMAAIFSKATSLLELKRAAECLAPDLEVAPATPFSWEHPARCAIVNWQGNAIGRLSELHPSLVEGGRAAVLDIDLGLLHPISATYKPVPRFPFSAFDLSVITPDRVLAGDLRRHIREFAGVDTVEYVREYQGPPVPEGKKSVTFRVTAGDPAKTLTTADITEIRTKILTGLAGLGYDTRV